MLDETAHNAVGAGVGPVGFGKGLFILIAGIYIVDHTPGIIDFCFPEAVTIVPLLYGPKIFFQPVVLQHLLHFFLGEAEMFRKGIIGNRLCLQVIQSRKDGFLADPQAAGDHGKLQAVVGLQSRLEQGTDQADHPVIEAAKVSIFQGDVVLVDKDNRLFTIDLEKAF